MPAMEPRDPSAERSRLLAILLERSLRFGKFKLASGAESDFYVDVRKTNLDPEGVRLVARLLADLSGLGAPHGPNAVGGPTLGADPMVTALGLEALARGAAVDCFLVRKEAKGHGTGSRIEGNLSSGARVLLVDDVLTQGGSLESAAAAVRESGAQVSAFGCVVDREAGGRARLGQSTIPVHALYTLAELLKAAGRPLPS